MKLLAPLRYLVALAEHQHYARAAQACHITQPALSNAVRALESAFGTPLVRRGRTYAGLTPEGELVLASARRLLAEAAALEQTLSSRTGEPVGELRLGAVPSALPVATRFAAALHAAHPRVRTTLLSLNSDDIERGLRDQALDLGLGFLARVPAGGAFEVWPQYDERHYLVQRSATPDPTPIRWADAAALPLCLLTPDMHHRRLVDDAFARAGVTAAPVLETNAVLSLALAVQAGDVAAVMPGALVAALGGAAAGLRVRPLVAPVVTTPVGFIARRDDAPPPVRAAALALALGDAWRASLAPWCGSLGTCAAGDGPDAFAP
jgi:DNA-binding transcriptional LysR family regulator